MRYISTMIFHYFRGRRHIYIFDLVGVLFSFFVAEQIKRFQQRPRFDHIQKLNNFLPNNKKIKIRYLIYEFQLYISA